jgi:hypothetical protein
VSLRVYKLSVKKKRKRIDTQNTEKTRALKGVGCGTRSLEDN